MANQAFNLRVAFACLEDIKNQFNADFTEDEKRGAIHLSLDKQFKKVLKQKLETYNNPDVDKLTKISANLKHTENIMKENLDKLVERGESLDQIHVKTESLVLISTDMKKNATAIKRKMWWRNKKMMILGIFIFILLIYIILLFSCGGFALPNCV